MEMHNTHNTHNLTYSSSEAQYDKNNESSSSSSNKEYFEKNESETKWSKIIRVNSSKTLSNSILNEEEINVSNKSYNEQQKDIGIKSKVIKKIKKKGKYKNKKNNKKGFKNYLGQKFRILDNGIIVKNLNKLKKDIKPSMKLNHFFSPKNKDNKSIQMLKNTNNVNYNNMNSFIPKFKKVKNDSFQLMYIKRPDRSFITKLCKYKKNKLKKNKEIKKSNHSSSVQTTIGLFSKNQPYSSRITPMSTLIAQKKEKKSAKSKYLIRNKNQIIDNPDNKLFSLSAASVEKMSVNSNDSLFNSKSNNLIMNNRLKKRPLSSINIPRNEIDLNKKGSKIDNFGITRYNKSSNIRKTGPISSIINSQINQSDKIQIDSNENIMYENADFINQFRELKNAFEIIDNNNNNFIKKMNNYNSINDFKNKYYNTLREKNNKKAIKSKKLFSAKLNKNSYNYLYDKQIIPSYNYVSQNQFEDEKQSKQTKFCSNCIYQKHFGNEQNCPLCVTLKEHNKLREKKLSNKNYYFPFKNKYETNNSFQRSFKKRKNQFINFSTEKMMNNNQIYQNYIRNKDNKNSFTNTFYLNNIYSSPNIRKKSIKNEMKNKEIQKNRSNIFNKYNAIHKYFG